MARDQVHILSQAIADEKSKLAVRQLERLLQSALSRVTVLETDQAALVTGVSSVTGSTYINVSPSTGAAVITLLDIPESKVSGLVTDLANKSPLVHTHPESDITGLVADLAARPTGSGTTNVLPKWTAASVLGDSSITDDGSLVTVANPLNVAGATDLDSTLNADGAATLQSTLTLPLMTQGSVLFAGAGGLVSQNNSNLFWDDSNSRLGIGTAAPTNPLTLSSTGTSDMVSIRNTDATLWSTYVARDDGGTVRTAFGYGNASTADTPRNARAHWWAESGTDFVFMRGGAIPGTALGYIHNTSGNWNIGSTLGDPSSRLRVEGRLSVIHPTTAEAAVILRNSSVSGYTSTDLYDSANAFKGGYGYANASAGVTHLRSQLYLYSGGPDWQFANGTRNEVTVGMTTGSTMLQLQNGSSAAVSAASTGRLRYNTTGQKFQVSHNAGTYTDILIASSAGVGVSNTVPKWSAANALGNSLLTDNATTLSYNSGKFTVTAASGNTTIAGTLGVTGLATLTAGFTLGADSSANSHKITNLTNGSSAQDAAAFGQIGTAVNAAVSGTTNTVAKFTSTHVVGDSSITDSGTQVALYTNKQRLDSDGRVWMGWTANTSMTADNSAALNVGIPDVAGASAAGTGTFGIVVTGSTLTNSGLSRTSYGISVVNNSTVTASESTGSITNYAGRFLSSTAAHGADLFGVYAEAAGTGANGYGVDAYASGSVNNYAVRGTATGVTSYGGYFTGDYRALVAVGTVQITGAATISSTLGVTGASTLTGGFTAGAASSMGGFKITNLANGASSSDAAAFGQIGTAVNAAVSGTQHYIPKFASANSLGNSRIYDDGSQIIFIGTDDNAYMLYGANQDVYLRGGKIASTVYIGDATNTGGVNIGSATNQTSVIGSFVGYGNAAFGGTLAVTGNATFSGNVDASGGEVYADGVSVGNLRLGANALNNSASALYLQFYNPANGINMGDGVTAVPVNIFGTLGVSQTLAVTGATTLSSTLTATGAIRTDANFKVGAQQAYVLVNVQRFTASGTYTPTTGTKAVRVRQVGGGGGGGGAGGLAGGSGIGGGGASGNYFEKWINPGATITGGAVTIGAAGSGGANTGGTGGTGGDTSVVVQGTTYTAKGGLGGAGTAGSSATKQAAGGDLSAGSSSGDVVFQQRGANGWDIFGSAGQAGAGGSTPFGAGGSGRGSATVGSNAGQGFGAGGGGAVAVGATGQTGGAGTAGYVVIEEYA